MKSPVLLGVRHLFVRWPPKPKVEACRCGGIAESSDERMPICNACCAVARKAKPTERPEVSADVWQLATFRHEGDSGPEASEADEFRNGRLAMRCLILEAAGIDDAHAGRLDGPLIGHTKFGDDSWDEMEEFS